MDVDEPPQISLVGSVPTQAERPATNHPEEGSSAQHSALAEGSSAQHSALAVLPREVVNG